jgi:hypothetical protein
MRLEHLCDMSLRYVDASWLVPFGGEEWAGFGTGEGEVAGERLRGSVRWANHPRRREDGVWLPDVHGVVTTADGAELLLAMRGQSVREASERVLRALVLRVELAAEDDRYRWLNTTFLVGEGEIDEENGEVRLRVYVAVNEVASAPPGIGAPPPA